MIEHTLYSLDLRESQIVSEWLVPSIGLAYQAAERLYGDSHSKHFDVLDIIQRVERRYDVHNLANVLNDPDLNDDSRYTEGPGCRHYGQQQTAKSIMDLEAVAMLILSEANKQSHEEFWQEIGMPHSDGLAEMRVRCAEAMTILLVSINNSSSRKKVKGSH